MSNTTAMYFQGDIENILNGLAFTSQQMITNPDQKIGYMTALLAVAGSFGLRPFDAPHGLSQFYVDRKRCVP